MAFFISPHGFGHAARATAVMAALARRRPELSFELFTTVPDWFFREDGRLPFRRHPLLTDIGMVQRSPMAEDLAATARRIERFFPLRRGFVRRLAERLKRLECRLVVCDISPMGIAAARAAGLPAVLVENFTWDWIYAWYARRHPGFRKAADYLGTLLADAHCRIQCTPFCRPAEADLRVGPVSRTPRRSRRRVRTALGLSDSARVVLVTMGGVRQRHLDLEAHPGPKDGGVIFVILGVVSRRQRQGNRIWLPHRSGFYHPDLMAGVDAVVGKAGYSTLAEVYRAGLPFGYLNRPGFPESEALAGFINRNMSGLAIAPADLDSGRWVRSVPPLLDCPRRAPVGPNGAERIADFLMERYRGELSG